MATPPPGERSRDVAWLVFGIGVVLFATPLRLVWADPARPWYLPFLLWALLNLLVYWVARVSRGHET